MKKFIYNLKKYNRYAVRAAKAELKSEVADSRLNFLWWVIEPLCFMLIYVFVFTVVFKNNTPYFASFVFVGQMLWDFFSRMVSGSVKLITNNRDLVTKVYIPKYILLLSKSYTYLFKMFISLCITIIIMICQGVPFSWHMIFFIPVVIVMYILSFGVGLVLMHFGVTLNDLSNLTNILLKLMFYLSGVFYDISARLGNKGFVGYALLRFNPTACLMHLARRCMLYGLIPSFKLLGMWLVIGLLLTALGIHLIHKNENSYAKVI